MRHATADCTCQHHSTGALNWVSISRWPTATHQEWPIHADILNHPPQHPASQCPLWINTARSDQMRHGSRLQWSTLLVTDPTIRQRGFYLPQWTLSALNHFHTGRSVGPGPLWQVRIWDGPDNVMYRKWVLKNYVMAVCKDSILMTTTDSNELRWKHSQNDNWPIWNVFFPSMVWHVFDAVQCSNHY